MERDGSTTESDAMSEFEPCPLGGKPTTQEMVGLTQAAKTLVLSKREVNAIARTRVEWAFSQLTLAKMDKVSQWLDDLAKTNPREALDAYMQLTEFVMPRLKAVNKERRGRDGEEPGGDDPRGWGGLSVAELEAIGRGDS
jgi:hypothetical protein